MPIDPKSLPRDAETLRKIVVDLAEQLDRSLAEQNKFQTLMRELLEAQRNRKSEQLSKEQLALFEAAWQARSTEDESAAGEDDDDLNGDAGAGAVPKETSSQKRGGRQPLARHLKRERIVHDLAEAEKHCAGCGKDLRLIAEETSERYEYIPASMKVIQDVCLKYACDCTVRTATKPAQPIEKSTAGASLLAQVIVAKWADHQPLHRQEKMFERHGIDISRKTMGGWMAQCAELLDPLYQLMKKELLSSKVIGTDDTSVKVLDRKLPFARIGRIWPYVGDVHHPVIVYDYTPSRSRAGPAKFLEGYKGYLQADAYSVYDAFFKPQRGMTEVGCWMHARRYVLSRVFRGKFVAGLRELHSAGKLAFHRNLEAFAAPAAFASMLRTLFRADWVVYAKRPFVGAEHALRYLGCYTHRVAISNHRLVALEDGEVVFRWRDSAHKNKKRLMRLALDEFLRRFFLHVLPRGFVRIRHFGLFAHRRRAALLPLCFAVLSANPEPALGTSPPDTPRPLRTCPRCGGPMAIVERFTAAEARLRAPPPRTQSL